MLAAAAAVAGPHAAAAATGHQKCSAASATPTPAQLPSGTSSTNPAPTRQAVIAAVAAARAAAAWQVPLMLQYPIIMHVPAQLHPHRSTGGKPCSTYHFDHTLSQPPGKHPAIIARAVWAPAC